MAAVVAAPGGDVCVVTTHLSFSPLRARAQLRQVVRWCRDLPRPLVLMGDLNMPARLATGATSWAPALRQAQIRRMFLRWDIKQPDEFLLNGSLRWALKKLK